MISASLLFASLATISVAQNVHIGAIGDWNGVQAVESRLEDERSAISVAIDHLSSGVAPAGASTTKYAFDFAYSATDATKLGALSAVSPLIANFSKIIATLGPRTSPTLETLLPVLQNRMMPVLSYSATASSFSSAPNVVRVVSSDYYQAEAIVALAKAAGWRRIAIVGSSDAYGQAGVADVSFFARKENIDVVSTFFVSSDADTGTDGLENALCALEDDDVNILVVFARSSALQTLSRAAVAPERGCSKKLNFQLVVSDSIASVNTVASNLNDHEITFLQGAIGVVPGIKNTAAFEAFASDWERVTSSNRGNMSVWAPYAYDATILLGRALASLADEVVSCGLNANVETGTCDRGSENVRCGDDTIDFSLNGSDAGAAVIASLKSSSSRFDGATGYVSINSNGDRDPFYDVVNYLPGAEVFTRVGSVIWEDGKVKDGQSFLSRDVYWHGFEGRRASSKIGDENTPVDSRTLSRTMRVGYANSPNSPFARAKQGDEAHPNGVAVQVWEQIAASLGADYEFIPLDSPDQVVEAVHHKTIDVGIGDIDVTPSRSSLVDFVHPLGSTGYTIVVATESSEYDSYFRFLLPFSADLWISIVVAIVILALVYAIVDGDEAGRCAARSLLCCSSNRCKMMIAMRSQNRVAKAVRRMSSAAIPTVSSQNFTFRRTKMQRKRDRRHAREDRELESSTTIELEPTSHGSEDSGSGSDSDDKGTITAYGGRVRKPPTLQGVSTDVVLQLHQTVAGMVGADREIEQPAGRLLDLGFFFFILMFASAYTASLASFLTARQLSTSVSSIEEAKGKDFKFLVPKGSDGPRKWLQENYKPRIEEVDGMYDEVLRRAQSCDKCVGYGSVVNLEAALTRERSSCNLTLVFPEEGPHAYSFVLPKKSPLLSHISSVMVNLTDVTDGPLQQWMGEAIDSSEGCYEDATSPGTTTGDEDMQLTFDHFKGTYIIVSVFVLVALIWRCNSLIGKAARELLHEQGVKDPTTMAASTPPTITPRATMNPLDHA